MLKVKSYNKERHYAYETEENFRNKGQRMLKKIRFRYQILMVCLLTSILSFIAVMEMLTMQHKQMTELYYKDTVELLEAESDKLSIKIKQVQRIATSLCLNSEFR